MKNIKFVILGPSSSGKTTIGIYLKKQHKLPIFECDDEARRLNKGHWPRSEKVIDKLFARVNKTALEKENTVYTTSYLDKKEILQFVEKGFKFIFLYANFDFLLQRRLNRERLSSSLLNRFKRRHKGILELVNSINPKQIFPLKN